MDGALIEKTKKVIVSISEMEAIKPYYLVGGTALSMQLHHRLSEDLDFMRWQKSKNEKMFIDVKDIVAELTEKKHVINSTDFLAKNHVEFYIDNGVKLSFYAPEKREPIIEAISYLNNLKLANESTIAALKMETLMRRSNFRDYYDLYFILKEKSAIEIISIIDNALKYSSHSLKSKNLLGILVNHEQFTPDAGFKNLDPISEISPKEIADFMNKTVKTAYQSRNNTIEQ
jgi:predicted nucleotidyltransferase component of viral defense system